MLAKSLILLSMFFFGYPAVAEESSKHEITVVYWSSRDCRWCTYWETSSGMEKGFRASEVFSKLKFHVVKNERLQDAYIRENFLPDLEWLWALYQNGEVKSPGMPGWQVYADRKLVKSYNGTRDWDSKHLPGIKQIVEQYTTP